MKKYLKYITQLIFLISLFLFSCFPEKEKDIEFKPIPRQDPRVAVIYNSRSHDSDGITRELEKAFNYIKIPARMIDVGILNSTLKFSPTVQVIVFTISDGQLISDSDFYKILKFISTGGKVVLISPVWDPRFYFLQGMTYDAGGELDKKAKGWHFYTPVLPGMNGKGFLMKNIPLHGGFKRENFNDRIQILASAENDKSFPAIVLNKIGHGDVIFFNSNIMNDKLYRGLMASAIVRGLSGIPYPVANTSMIFIDDFPAPLYDAKMPPIDQEYNLTHKDFIYKIWWPDMKHLADSLHVDYTTFVAFNYNATVTPPYGFEQWQAGKIKTGKKWVYGCEVLARDVKKSRHELGFHGYNHFSLMESEWPDMQFVSMALKAVRKQWIRDDLGDLPRSYVAPTNYIDSTGLLYLKRGLNSMEYMATLFLGHKESGGDREFDPDPYNPQLFDMPRITSGYYFDNEKLFTQESMYFFTGIWTHFIHPDDIFQVVTREDDPFASRNELGLWWKHTPHDPRSMYGEFAKWLSLTRRHHPFIRYWTVSASGEVIKRWRMSQVEYKNVGDSVRAVLHVPTGKPDWLWNIFANSDYASQLEKYLNIKNINYHKEPLWDGYLFELPVKSDSLILPRARFYRPVNNYISIRRACKLFVAKASGLNWQKIELENLSRVIAGDITDPKLEERAIELAVEGNKTEVALKILERRLLTQNKWSKKDVDRWLDYLYWENKINTIFITLKERIHRFPTTESFHLKNYVALKMGNFNEEEDEWWQRKKMEVFPDSFQLQIAFIKNHAEKKDWSEMKQRITGLLEKGIRSDSLSYVLIQRSLWYDKPEETLKLLAEVPPESAGEIKPLAHDIAELYAYSRNDLTRAILWENKSVRPDSMKISQWLWESARYAEYFDWQSTLLKKKRHPDTLKHKLGRQWLAEGFALKGLNLIHHSGIRQNLTQKKENLSALNALRLNERQKLSILLQYEPLFGKNAFDSLTSAISRYYSPRLKIWGEIETDNFKNNRYRSGMEYSFGNRHKQILSARISRNWVKNARPQSANFIKMPEVNVLMEKIYENAGKKLSGLLGGMLESGKPLLTAYLRYGFGNYQSFEAKTHPVMTYDALKKRLHAVQLSWYAENLFFKRKPATVLYAAGRYVTDGNWITELSGRVLPFRTPAAGGKVKPVFEVSLQDATKIHGSGYPYWTPDKIVTGGLGLLFERKSWNSELTTELMGKWDNESGRYVAFNLTGNFYIRKYWYLQSLISLSNSKLYRSNAAFVGVSYLFH